MITLYAQWNTLPMFNLAYVERYGHQADAGSVWREFHKTEELPQLLNPS